MGFQELDIVLNNPSGIYSAGQSLAGTVHISNNKAQKISGETRSTFLEGNRSIVAIWVNISLRDAVSVVGNLKKIRVELRFVSRCCASSRSKTGFCVRYFTLLVFFNSKESN